MEKQNKVSLWVGNYLSQEKFQSYFEEEYDEDGDSLSDFEQNFKIDYIDSQFQELFFYENLNSKTEIFDGFSYVESFIENIPNLTWENYNSIALIYNFDYQGDIKKANGLDFIGVFDFS